jgi:ParB-like chromosome segregation protein Spo0J
VSRSDPADVIQGRLGWESGDISEADPEALEPHPKNKEIYGDTDDVGDLDETFRESVAEKGVLEPLVITDGKQIISGHRRWLAAKAAGLDSVPVRYSEFDSELAEREALIEFNRQREKTRGQIVNEFEEMLEIEKQRGRDSQGSRSTSGKNLAEVEGNAQTRAAERVNADVSGETLRKGKNIKDKAESDDEPEEVREAAREAWDGLQSGEESFTSAYQEVKTAENKVEKQQQREQETERFKQAVAEDDAVTVDHGDFADVLEGSTAEYDHIITDPPYDEGAVEEWEKVAAVAADVLKPSGLLVAYSGKYHLPAVYEALQSELEYFWQCVVVHEGGGARVWPRNIRTNYKPVVVFAKPPVEKLDGLGHDVIDGGGREKDDHEWQQATAEAVNLIDQLTEPNDRILDPMCGSGTTGVAALEQNRRVHLIDRDEEAIESARRRCADVI